MITQKSLTAEGVHEKVSDLLKEYSGLTVSGYRCSREMVIDVLVKAALEGLTTRKRGKTVLPQFS